MLSGLNDIDARITLMVKTVEDVTAKLYECLRTKKALQSDDKEHKIAKKLVRYSIHGN